MVKGPVQPARPPSYPKDGTYADLLCWHLFVWRTRPSGSVERRGTKPWTNREFCEKVFGKQADPDKDRLFESWIGKRAKCPPRNDNAETVARVLFGGKRHFEIWARDLDFARCHSTGRGNNVLTISVKEALALVVSSPSTSVERDNTRDDLNHFSAAAAHVQVKRVTEKLKGFFVGRADDIKSINQFVEERMAGGPRALIVITSPPGFGKSALAAHWCDRVEHPSNRSIAKHFCSALTGGEATTALPKIYAHLHRQVADILGEPLGSSGSDDALVALLEKTPPDGGEMVVWLDGIDEAQGPIECFLPQKLGKRICVVISARANDQSTPAYLIPWFNREHTYPHVAHRHSLGKLSFLDTHDLVHGLFYKAGISPPSNLAQRIFYASAEGYALFARNMTETAIDATRKGEEIDLGDAPESLRGYARSELRRLESIIQWPDYAAFFSLMTLAREAVSVEELPRLVGKEIYPNSLPWQLLRWFSVIEAPHLERPTMIGFAHPLLADMFGQALGYRREIARAHLSDRIAPSDKDRELPLAQWGRYALRHGPSHLLDAGRFEQAEGLLIDRDFISRRFEALGAEEGTRFMSDDWINWYQFHDRRTTRYPIELLDHLNFWGNCSRQISHLERKEFSEIWRQLMYDIDLSNML